MQFNEKVDKAIRFFKAENFVIDDDKLRAIFACIEEGLPLLAVGPTGSGKTQFFSLLAEHLKGNYFYQSLNGSITIHDLTQERIIGKTGAFEEKDMILAQWLRAAQTGISILQLDEVNAAKPETLLALHPIMDIKGELFLPYSNEILKITKNAILVMSCNEGDEYQGINAMNMAFQNRYIKLPFEYIQGNQLAQMLTVKTGVDLRYTQQIAEIWHKYMHSRQPDQAVVSIRMLEYWCRLSKHLGLREAGKVTFVNLVARDEEEALALSEGDFWVNLPDSS